MSSPTRTPSVLRPDQLAAFQQHGFVRLESAFPREFALEFQEEIWEELDEEFSIRRDDRSTWRRLPRAPKRAKQSPRNTELADTPFTGAITDLLGHEDWERPATWGGFNVIFPEEAGTVWDVPRNIWHWDGPPTGHGLLIFSFYGEVEPGGGGTLILDGSPGLIQDYYDSLSAEDRARPHKYHRKRFSRWDPWLRDLTGLSKEPAADRRATFMAGPSEVKGRSVQVIELLGQPGDAVFCNLGMLHCIAPNTGAWPRFLRIKFLFLD